MRSGGDRRCGRRLPRRASCRCSLLRGPLTAAYAVSGYHVGSAALALRVWQAVRP